MYKIKLLNRYDSVVRVLTYTNISKRDEIIKQWRGLYPAEILNNCFVVFEKDGVDISKHPILSPIEP